MKKNNIGCEFSQSPLYAYMEISQWSSFVQFIYANKNEKKEFIGFQVTTENILS
jgi:hypothetical protein